MTSDHSSTPFNRLFRPRRHQNRKLPVVFVLPETSHSNDNNGPIKNNIYTLHFVLSGAAARSCGRNRFRKRFTLTAAREFFDPQRPLDEDTRMKCNLLPIAVSFNVQLVHVFSCWHLATHPVLVHVLPAITIDTRFNYSSRACNLNQRWNATWRTHLHGGTTQRRTFSTRNLARSVNYSRLELCAALRPWSNELTMAGEEVGRETPEEEYEIESNVSRQERPSIQQMKQTKIKLVAHVINSGEPEKMLTWSGVENRLNSLGHLKATQKSVAQPCVAESDCWVYTTAN